MLDQISLCCVDQVSLCCIDQVGLCCVDQVSLCCIDQVGLWMCLRAIFLITLTKAGKSVYCGQHHSLGLVLELTKQADMPLLSAHECRLDQLLQGPA